MRASASILSYTAGAGRTPAGRRVGTGVTLRLDSCATHQGAVVSARQRAAGPMIVLSVYLETRFCRI
jgi:hypothetical protein